MKEIFIVTILTFFCSIVDAQNTDSWANIYFNPESPSEALNGFDIKPLSNGTFVVATRDAVINIDSVGNTLWVVDGYYEHLAIAENDNIVLIGGTVTYKISSSGNLLWSRQLSNIGNGLCAVVVADNGYIVAGTKSNNQMYLSKFSQGGTQLWAKHVNLLGNSTSRSLRATSDGNLFLTGSTRVYTDNTVSEMFLIKLTDNGDVLWAKTYSLENYNQEGMQIFETADNSYLLTGASAIAGEGYRLSILHLDANGNIDWAQHFPNISSSSEIHISTNEFIIAAFSSYWPDARIIFMDYSGNINRTVEMEDSNISALVQSVNGNYYAVGHAVEPTYGTMIGLVDEEFNSCFTFESTYDENEELEFTVSSKTIATISDELYSEDGDVPSVLVLELETKCATEATSIVSGQVFENRVPFPNPVSDYINIPISGAGQIEIYTSTGQKALVVPTTKEGYKHIPLHALSPGIYMYLTRSIDNKVTPGKMFVVE